MHSLKAAFLFSALVLAAGSAQADTMEGSEIRKLFPGTYHVSVADNLSLTVVFTKGGGVSAVTNKGDKDSGRWSVSGDKLCVVFRRWLDHNTHCSKLTETASGIHGDGFTVRPK